MFFFDATSELRSRWKNLIKSTRSSIDLSFVRSVTLLRCCLTKRKRGRKNISNTTAQLFLFVEMAMLENIERELCCRSLVPCIYSMAVQRALDGNYHLDFDQSPFDSYSSTGNFTQLMHVFFYSAPICLHSFFALSQLRSTYFYD